jgi:hypothetical protein
MFSNQGCGAEKATALWFPPRMFSDIPMQATGLHEYNMANLNLMRHLGADIHWFLPTSFHQGPVRINCSPSRNSKIEGFVDETRDPEAFAEAQTIFVRSYAPSKSLSWSKPPVTAELPQSQPNVPIPSEYKDSNRLIAENQIKGVRTIRYSCATVSPIC